MRSDHTDNLANQSGYCGLGKYAKIFYCIIIVSVLLRLYGITLPLIESHQLRQAQTADVARNLYYDKMDIFHTRMNVFDDGVKPAILEFPLMQGITALSYYVFGVHEIIGRIVSILFSVGALWMIYGLARQFLPVPASLAAMGLYGFSPVNIFFSRTFMPESSLMFFLVGALFYFFRWLDLEMTRDYIFSLCMLTLACLIKPTAAIVFAPLFASWYLKDGLKILKEAKLWIYVVVSLGLTLGWAIWAQFINSQNPAINGASWFELAASQGIWQQLFKFKFYKFVAGSVFFLLLTPIGFIGMLAGLFCIPSGVKKKVLFVWLGAIIAYFIVFSGANSGHIYYHLLLLPLGVILFGYSFQKMLVVDGYFNKIRRNKLGVFFLALLVCGYLYGYGLFFNYMYSIRMPYVQEVVGLLKANARQKEVILCNEAGIVSEQVMAYYSGHPTWMFWVTDKNNYIQEFENYRKKGATLYIAIKSTYGDGVKDTQGHTEFLAYLNKHYRSIAQTDNYLIFDLK